MTSKAAVLLIALIGSGFLFAGGEEGKAPAVFTAAQAEAGQAAYEKSCGRCHTYSLLGRKGDEGEVPPIASLPAPFLKFIGPAKRVPPLVGENFVQKYGQKKVSDLFVLFRGAANTTPVADLHMSDDDIVNITAYILEKNGAKPGNQPLTATLARAFGSVVE